jgi:hypothetical protein
MPKVLAWFITFNFVNIAWVFFRAKEWEDAVKVLNGMIFGDIIISDKHLAKLGFLQDYGVEFGQFLFHLGGHSTTLVWVFSGFVLIFMKNSMELRSHFKATSLYFFFITIIAISAVLNLSKASEFLYFNF